MDIICYNIFCFIHPPALIFQWPCHQLMQVVLLLFNALTNGHNNDDDTVVAGDNKALDDVGVKVVQDGETILPVH